MKESLPKALFVAAILGLTFSYGFISSWKQIFPYQLLREAYLAFNAVTELAEEDLEITNVEFWEDTGLIEPLYKKLAPSGGDELIFFLGNEHTYKDTVNDTAFLAWIADREGNILHAWKDNGEIWSPLENRDAVGEEWRSYPVGAYLYPNGDILVSYQGVNVFPISMGIAKFDKDSNLLWKNNDYFHHWFSVGPEGEVYVPDTIVGVSPLKVEDRRKTIICEQDRFPYETLAVLDAKGKKIREIDLLTALVDSDLAGILNSNKRHATEIETCDPLHLNGVQILSQEMAPEFPSFSPGDLLLSFRSLNGVGVLDQETELFKWFYVGGAHHQHSPRYKLGGKILMFDNYGGAISRGTSRVLSVDVQSGRSESVFPKTGVDLPERPFFSDTAGYLDIDPSGQRVLVSFSRQGLVWEVDIESGKVLWEFVNAQKIEDRVARVVVYTADYVRDVSFEFNGGEFE